MPVLSRSEAEHLVLLATRAPSVHNTQPWRVVGLPDGLEVRADRSRRLPVLDPLGRQLLISCGALVHHLVVVATAQGLACELTRLPDPEDADLLTRISLRRTGEAPSRDDVALAEAVLHRATSRVRFAPDLVGPGYVEQLRQLVGEHGVMLSEIRSEDRVTVDVLVEHAEQELLADPAYRAELAAWVFDPEQEERTDGVPVAALDPGGERAEDVPGRQFAPEAVEVLHGGPAEHPTLLLLTTEADGPRDWLLAGEALSTLLLNGTRTGLVAQPIGQLTDVGHERARLRSDLGLVGVPQMLLRVGEVAGRQPLRSPRRLPEDVLEWAVADDAG